MEEYAAEWCALDGEETAEFAEVAEDLSVLLGLEPPPELRGFHDAVVQTVSVMLLFLDDIEGGEPEDDEEDDEENGLLWALLLILLARDIEREAAALPEDVRATLEEAGCFWEDDYGDAVSDPRSDPGETTADADAESDPANEYPPQDTLGQVLDRGELKCGVKQTQPLFGFRERDGTVSGFDIEFCKAIAAAVFGDPTRVWYIDASDGSTRFDLLTGGEIDVLIRTTAITASHDLGRGIDFAYPILHTGQGFAVRKDSGIESTSDMGDAIICVYAGTRQEQRVADHFTDIGLEYDPQGLGDSPIDAFFSGRCDVLTHDTSDLASLTSFRDDAADYVILPQVISMEPLAPAVREDDSEWRDIVTWVIQGLIRAEELGVTRANVGQMAENPPNSDIAGLLGVPHQNGAREAPEFDRLDPQFIQRAIRAVGNYGEIYARTIGDYIPRACTLNDLVINNDGCPPGTGGIMYAFPYR